MAYALNIVAHIASDNGATHITYDWSTLRAEQASAVRSALIEQYGIPTSKKCLVALRQVLKYSWRFGYLSGEEYQRATDLKPVVGDKTSTTGRALSASEINALLDQFGATGDLSVAELRNRALVSLWLVTGLRRVEVTRLDLCDYSTALRRVAVHGKRNKERTVPIENRVALGHVDDWISVRGCFDGPLFTRIRKGGQVTTGRLTGQGVYIILDSVRQSAGVKPFTPHDIRRTFISRLLDAGVDLATVQHLAGHDDPATTARYDRRGEDATRKAVRLLG